MREIISMRISMIIPPAFTASGACTSICAFSWAPTDGAARLRVAQGPFWAADRARIMEILLGIRGALEPPARGHAHTRAEHVHRRDIRRALPIPRLFLRAACAACTLTAVCVCFCCRIAALARWACLQHSGRRWGARIHEDRRHTRRPHRGPRVPRWRIARHGRAPAAHEARRAYLGSPSGPT